MQTVADQADLSFQAMGTKIRILVGAPATSSEPAPKQAAQKAKESILLFEKTCSRFNYQSELSQLNNDSRQTVKVSPLLAQAVQAAIWAAEATEGLVDPTLLNDLIEAGYKDSWQPERRISLHQALKLMPEPEAAEANPLSLWRQISVDPEKSTVSRPAGAMIELGATGKGLAADLASEYLKDYQCWAVDCGGDIRVGGTADISRLVQIMDSDGQQYGSFEIARGAAATSGIGSRIWLNASGQPAHHLIDPSTGLPAFTGLVAVTAKAPTALQAETLAKQAFFSGPKRAELLLGKYGGVIRDAKLSAVELKARTQKVKIRLSASR